MAEWWKFTAWPWIRDDGWPALEGCVTSWFDVTMDYPGASAFNVLLGALIAAMLL
jgi:hypothetical protein